MRIQNKKGRSTALATASHSTLTGVIGNARRPGSNERWAGDNGEVNAGSRTELATFLLGLSDQIKSGAFDQELASESLAATPAERREELEAAWNDPSGGLWRSMGASIGAEITERSTRGGFLRRFLGRGDVQQGNDPRIRVYERNVEAVIAVGPTEVGRQFIRQKYIYPAEFYITANPRIEEKELQRGSGDLLEELFMDTQEAILVQEDRTFLKMAHNAATIHNEIVYFTGQLTPVVLAALQEQIATWGLTGMNAMISMDLIKDIATGDKFIEFFDQVSRLEIVLTGRIGTILGMEISTDGYRDPKLRVLGDGEVLLTAQPENFGSYTDRGPLVMEPRINDHDTPSRGWYGYELMSMGIGNPKAVARAKRI